MAAHFNLVTEMSARGSRLLSAGDKRHCRQRGSVPGRPSPSLSPASQGRGQDVWQSHPATVPSSAGTRGAGSAAKRCEDERRGLPETQPLEASQRDIINQMSKPLSKVSFDRRGNLSDRSFRCPWRFPLSLCPSVYLPTSPFHGRGSDLL